MLKAEAASVKLEVKKRFDDSVNGVADNLKRQIQLAEKLRRCSGDIFSSVFLEANIANRSELIGYVAGVRRETLENLVFRGLERSLYQTQLQAARLEEEALTNNWANGIMEKLMGEVVHIERLSENELAITSGSETPLSHIQTATGRVTGAEQAKSGLYFSVVPSFKTRLRNNTWTINTYNIETINPETGEPNIALTVA